MQTVALLSTNLRSASEQLGRELAAVADAAAAGPVAVLSPEEAEGDQDRLEAALAEARRHDVRHLLLALAAPSGEAPRPALTVADLLVILCSATPEDRAVAAALAEAVGRRGRPFFFLLLAGPEEDTQPAITDLAQHGTLCPVVLPLLEEEVDGEALQELWTYVAGRLERLPQFGQRLAGTAPDGRERRACTRYAYRQVGSLRRGTEVARCEILDISLGGVAAVCDLESEPGEELELHLPTVGRFTVEVARRSGNRLGLRFRLDAIAQQRLVAHLSVLVDLESARQIEEAPAPAVPADSAVEALADGLTALAAAIAEAKNLQAALSRGYEDLTGRSIPSQRPAGPAAANDDPVLRRRITRLFGT